MERVELLIVQRTFLCKDPDRQMLIIFPWLPFPRDWKLPRQNFETVLVVRPDGTQTEATAEINVAYLDTRGRAPGGSCRKIMVWLSHRLPEEVPDGSKILVSQEIRDAALSNNSAQSSPPSSGS
jgi:hypothetical protein